MQARFSNAIYIKVGIDLIGPGRDVVLDRYSFVPGNL